MMKVENTFDRIDRGLGGDTRALGILLANSSVNLVRTQWRRAARRPAHVPAANPSVAAELARRMSSEEMPPDALGRREYHEQLILAITELGADEQELIVGTYFDGLSQAALAERLGVSQRAIEGRLYRARRALRDRLEALS